MYDREVHKSRTNKAQLHFKSDGTLLSALPLPTALTWWLVGSTSMPPGLPVRSLITGGDGTVTLKPSVSLPQLHKPAGNLAREGVAQKRMDSLQRQFETSGISSVRIGRAERSHILAPPAGQAPDGSGSEIDILYVDSKSDAASEEYSSFKPSKTNTGSRTRGSTAVDISAPPSAVLMRGSETNLLELRLAEASAKRASSRSKNHNGLLDYAALDVASRRVADDSLALLRQVASTLSGTFGTTVRRVADALEPVLMSNEQDERGRLMTHEQYARGVLAPRLHDAMERATEAREDAEFALKELARAKNKIRALQEELHNHAPQMVSLEARKAALEIEVTTMRRQHAELEAENKELSEVQEGEQLDSRIGAMAEEVALLRETNAALLQQAGEVSRALKEASPKEEFDAAVAELATLRRQYQALQEQSSSQSERIVELTARLEAVEAERDGYKERADGLHQSHSPRPDWHALSQRATAEAAELAKLTAGGASLLLSSKSGGGDAGGGEETAVEDDDEGGREQLHVDEQAEKGGSRVGGGGMLRLGPSSSSSASRVVDQLLEAWRTLAELQSRIPTEDAHFANPGDGAHVPIFLKLTPYPNMPRLRNKKMPKAEVETLVREYWIFFYEMRRKAVQSKPPPPGASSLAQRMARGRAGSIAAAAGMSSADLHAQIARKPATVATTAAVTPTRPASGSGGGDGEQQQQQQQQQQPAALAPPSEAASVFNAFLEARVFAAHQAASAASAPAASGSDATPNEEQQRRFAAVELALNALDSCRRHAYDADLELFLDVISGRVPMEAHAQQLLLVEQLRNAFAVADRQEHEGRSLGDVPRSAVSGVVRSVFPRHSEMQISQLLAALERDMPPVIENGLELPIKYAELFKEDKDFNQSDFVERARGQALRAPREYVGQIEAALREKDEHGSGNVTLRQAGEAIRQVDPTIPQANLDALIGIGVGAGGGATCVAAATSAHAGSAASPAPSAASPMLTTPGSHATGGAKLDVRVFCRRLLYAQPTRYGPPPKARHGEEGGSRSRNSRRRSTLGSKGKERRTSTTEKTHSSTSKEPSMHEAEAASVPSLDLRSALTK